MRDADADADTCLKAHACFEIQRVVIWEAV